MKTNIPFALLLSLGTVSATLAETPSDRFYDDFSSGRLDPAKWYAANKNWGGKVNGVDYNGGVVPQNLYVKNGILQCEAHGNLYEGDVLGICKDGSKRTDGKRVGACAVTRDYFASGSYEIRAKVAPVPGVCCTMWTFEYEEYDEPIPGYHWYADDEYCVINHEIDIEMPGRPGSAHQNIGYDYALCNTWRGEWDGEYTTSYTKLPKAQDDGQFHVYRFDWHTGDKAGTITPRVEFYFDGVCVQTNYTHIPTKAGRLWVGAWFPNGWAGTPDFDTSVFEVDYVSITPFHEENDEPQNESFGTDGLAEPLNIVPVETWDVGSPVASDVSACLNGKGELVFSGNGSVTNFNDATDAPWAEEAAEITALVLSDPTVSFGPRSLIGLDNLATINGVPLETFQQVLGYVFPPEITAFRVDPAAQAAELTISVKQSQDLIHWTPVDGPYQIGTDGKSVKVPVPADSKVGFFKLVIE